MELGLKRIQKATKILLMTTVAMSGCGNKRNAPIGEGIEGSGNSVIIGSLDWLEVTSLSDSSAPRVNSFAVADVSIPAIGSRCTGFLINEDTLMTNHHCVPVAEASQGLSITLDNERGVPLSQQQRYDCSTFIGHNQERDFALLKCEGLPGQRYGYVTLDPSSVNIGEQMYLLQQNCDYFINPNCQWTKKIAYGEFTESSQLTIGHNADSLGGSSGSAIFSSVTHNVVAIHNSGLPFCSGCREGSENFGRSMSSIIPYIQQNFPDVKLYLAGQTIVDPTPVDPIPTTPPPSNGDGNDNYDSATIVERFSVHDFAIDREGDVDIYEFDLEYQNKMLFYLDIISFGEDLDLYVIAADGRILGRSEASTSLEFLDLTLDPGKYYVVVQGHNGAKGDYRLSIY